MQSDTLSRTIAIVRAHLAAKHPGRPVPEVTADSEFARDLGCDAIDMVSICLDVEDAFCLQLPPDDPEHCETVGDLAGLVGALIKELVA